MSLCSLSGCHGNSSASNRGVRGDGCVGKRGVGGGVSSGFCGGGVQWCMSVSGCVSSTRVSRHPCVRCVSTRPVPAPGLAVAVTQGHTYTEHRNTLKYILVVLNANTSEKYFKYFLNSLE